MAQPPARRRSSTAPVSPPRIVCAFAPVCVPGPSSLPPALPSRLLHGAESGPLAPSYTGELADPLHTP
eukprot:10929824-Prorocentrum_lima.AAC.1